jgi:hypothetical protein
MYQYVNYLERRLVHCVMTASARNTLGGTSSPSVVISDENRTRYHTDTRYVRERLVNSPPLRSLPHKAQNNSKLSTKLVQGDNRARRSERRLTLSELPSHNETL